MTDFETHPIGTGKRLAELEGLAFARRRTEYTCPVTDEDAEAARDGFYGQKAPEWASVPPAIRDRWRRVAEAIRDRLSGREMVAVHCDRCRGPIYRGERFVATRRGTGAVHPRCASTVSWPAMFGVFAAVVLVAVLGLLVLGLAVRGLL